MATLVKFLIDKVELEEDNKESVFAFFPKEQHSFGFNVAYSHVGQHSPCHVDYANECKTATPEQYAALKTELESIGYTLKICK
jgi:hypothetical protein